MVLLIPNIAFSNENKSPFQIILNDYKNLYTDKDVMLQTGIIFGIGGMLANSKIDSGIDTWYQDYIKSDETDSVSDIVEIFGDGSISIPVMLLAASTYYIDDDCFIAKWGLYSTRALIIGAPFNVASQILTGASRPDENEHNNSSSWKPFNDNNGVSGHAFVSAVPFITMAKMTDNKLLKSSAYLASILTSWSRINDCDHYFSQSLLGWFIAYQSVNSIFSNQEDQMISIFPIAISNGYGVMAQIKF